MNTTNSAPPAESQDVFAAADAGLQPAVVPQTKPEAPEITKTLATVGIQPTDAENPNGANSLEDPRDRYFSPVRQPALYNDIKAAPSVDHGAENSATSKPQNDGPVVA